MATLPNNFPVLVLPGTLTENFPGGEALIKGVSLTYMPYVGSTYIIEPGQKIKAWLKEQDVYQYEMIVCAEAFMQVQQEDLDKHPELDTTDARYQIGGDIFSDLAKLQAQALQS